MVVGNIETAKRYFMLNKSFAKVFEFLKTIDRNTDVGVFEFEEFKVTICEIETIAFSEKETENKLIHIGKPIEMDDAWFQEKLQELDIASRHESDHMKQIVSEIVPTYHYAEQETKTPLGC